MPQIDPDPLDKLVQNPGANSAVFRDEDAYPGRPVTLRSACPEAYAPDRPLIFVHHGVGRNGGDYRDYWLDFAARQNWLVIVPEFSEEHFPGPPWYNRGNLFDESGALNPADQWTYQIDRLVFAALKSDGITQRETYSLFGHSAGSQFVHRMLTIVGMDGVDAAAAANAGEYTLPFIEEDFPYGVRDLGVTQSHIKTYFAFPLIVMFGDRDVDNATENFPKEPHALRQGSTRVERAKNYFAQAKQLAERLDVPFNWRLQSVPGVGHEGDRMSAAAGPLLAAMVE